MIVVLGSGGMLGSWICSRYPKDTIGFTRKELDITDYPTLVEKICELKPDAVINAAGIVKSRTTVEGKLMNEVNGVAPHQIVWACDEAGAKLVQVSTDCVFRGDKGNYTEDETPDCTDVYGISKWYGEVEQSPHLTVRTSFVGWPDPTMRGLLATYCVTSKTTFPGYVYAYWNGLTVSAAADYLVELAYGRQTGIMHLFGQTVSKYRLLDTFRQLYPQYGPITPVQNEPVDRTLATIRHDQPIIPGTFNLEESLRGMKAWEKRYLESL